MNHLDTKFTPGPWRVEDSSLPINVETVSGDCICDVWEFAVGDNEPEANAHLIAAAPDMYAALECVAALDMPYWQGRAVLERHGWIHEDRFDLPPTEFVRRIRDSAMKKAEGKSWAL